METILLRIQEIAVNESITVSALERKIGASKGVLSRAIANNTDIQAKWIQIIVENYPQYSAEWLITGKGEMLKKTDIIVDNGDNSPLITELLNRITEQAAEIGRLNERIEQLQRKERSRRRDADDAPIPIANAG